MTARRHIAVTEREYQALCSALALFEVETGFDDDPSLVDARTRGDVRALRRLREKWWLAEGKRR